MLVMPQTAVEQQPPQSHGTAFADQLVGAQALSVFESCLRSSDPLVVDPSATEEIIDKGASSGDRTCRID